MEIRKDVAETAHIRGCSPVHRQRDFEDGILLVVPVRIQGREYQGIDR